MFNFPPNALPLIYVVLADHKADYDKVKTLLEDGKCNPDLRHQN